MTPPLTRILWLSDIHFRDVYQSNTLVNDFIDSFISKIIEDFAPNTESKIDYIYLGGDIAFSGQKAEYEQFNNLFLKKILDATGLTMQNVISVAGNHDVRWKEFTQIFWDNKDNLETKLKGKNTFLNENKSKSNFVALFENYRTLFGDLDTTNSGEYSKNRLHGYFIDKDREIVFFLFNTAWFSVSSKIEELVKTESNGEEKLNLLNKYANEYGGQVVGADFDVWDDIDTVLEEYPDYIKISCLHHPLHWLHWDELYDYTDNKGAFRLVSKVVNASDLLLTSHEHVPLYVKPRQFLNGPWHIEAGMFLEDDARFATQADKDKRFPHNRFSVLEVGHSEIKELRYKYSKSGNSGNWKHESEYDNPLPLNKSISKPTQDDLDKKKTDFYNAIKSNYV